MVKMKTVVITGAAGGMGSAAAELFKSKGFTVLGTDRSTNTKIFIRLETGYTP